MTRIRLLTEADVAAAQRLREQAGWNQADDDWGRLLAWSPDGCWVAERGGQVVGTTTVAVYGRRIAWIGMVLVDEVHRRQGIGRALLTHAIEHLDRQGIETIALDSTPEGQPLYARLGFGDLFELARWRGPVPLTTPGSVAILAAPVRPPHEALSRSQHAVSPGEGSVERSGQDGRAPSVVRPLAPADLPAVASYDARLFGTDRAHILGALYAGHPGRCFVAERHGEVVGYVLSRPGARAWHLGPLAADDPATAERLARLALLPAESVMDVVMPNADAVALARALGLNQVRRFIRMTRGAPPPAVEADRLYTSAGPELG